jgi:hypothetical protein
VAIVNPGHLFDQAEQLIAPTKGAPRQVDLRRAVSAAYYGVFHATMTALADQFVGASRRTTSEYALAYRGVDHRTLKKLCDDARKATLPPRLSAFLGSAPSADLRAFSAAVVELQEKRHDADYDPLVPFSASGARATLAMARDAESRFGRLSGDEKLTFLCLLAFPPR